MVNLEYGADFLKNTGGYAEGIALTARNVFCHAPVVLLAADT